MNKYTHVFTSIKILITIARDLIDVGQSGKHRARFKNDRFAELEVVPRRARF